MKRIIVTGGSGFIAGWVIREFLTHNYLVSASLRHLNQGQEIKKAITAGLPVAQAQNLDFFQADLTKEAGWQTAMQGAVGVIHVASPLGNGTETTAELTNVAKNGTLNVLTAARNAGIKRIVMTSSQAASTPASDVGWTNLNNPELDPYRISKVVSEKVAWQFAHENNLDLTTILPGAVFGPILSSHSISSNRILLNFMHKIAWVPKVPMEISDVRDLAVLHRLAFEKKVAINNRYLAADQYLTMPQAAQIIHNHFPNLATHPVILPNRLVKVMANFIPSLRALTPMLSRKYRHTTKAASTDLGWQQHTPEETIIAAGQTLISLEVI
ncbi:NAD-dependent epimerase/dehydratase family protein [Pediococcus ethanolidurans]|uniref:NAD-dependent epimerase/dehydratase family protein n=1 Tax=Pediococcus ethanolidurans TaxID=319653 RepID=UPI0029559882|nr:NAD-dependent epimerase/dehydratase family protein [Pediococcus ethanolidurans]MDV7719459.1 NAD-dependent epimerase/dehydratase family protein [Pediococcus ethanolidurans]